VIRYELIVDGKTVAIALPVTDGNSAAEMAFEGEGIDEIKSLLLRQCGAFGHGMSEVTTAYDLDYALNSPAMREFNAVLVEGDIDSYDPKIPDGAMT
jgi:hypothetical protein